MPASDDANQSTPDPDRAPEPPPPADEQAEITLAPGASIRPQALRYRHTGASGPGGQNVNRRQTRAELRLSLHDLRMPVRAKRRLRDLAGDRVTTDGVLILTAEDTRSATRNRRACLDRLRDLCRRAMVEPKRRVPTKPSRSARERRLREKREQAQRKQRRRPPPAD